MTKRMVVNYQALSNLVSQRSSFNRESTNQSPRLELMEDDLANFMALSANYNNAQVLPQVQGVKK